MKKLWLYVFVPTQKEKSPQLVKCLDSSNGWLATPHINQSYNGPHGWLALAVCVWTKLLLEDLNERWGQLGIWKTLLTIHKVMLTWKQWTPPLKYKGREKIQKKTTIPMACERKKGSKSPRDVPPTPCDCINRMELGCNRGNSFKPKEKLPWRSTPLPRHLVCKVRVQEQGRLKICQPNYHNPRFKMIAISIISLTQVAFQWLPVGSRLWHIVKWDEIT